MKTPMGKSLLVLILAGMTISGCSDNPALPQQVLVTESLSPNDTDNTNPHRNMGFFSLVIDREAGSIDAIPLRSSDWHVNLVGVLNSTMGVTAVGVPAEHDPPKGIFTFDITLKHPFATKPQLAGFDVRGILITPGTFNIGPLVFADTDETRLLNADGYTRWCGTRPSSHRPVCSATFTATSRTLPHRRLPRQSTRTNISRMCFTRQALCRLCTTLRSMPTADGEFSLRERATREGTEYDFR